MLKKVKSFLVYYFVSKKWAVETTTEKGIKKSTVKGTSHKMLSIPKKMGVKLTFRCIENGQIFLAFDFKGKTICQTYTPI
jgi:hypothetical protein